MPTVMGIPVPREQAHPAHRPTLLERAYLRLVKIDWRAAMGWAFMVILFWAVYCTPLVWAGVQSQDIVDMDGGIFGIGAKADGSDLDPFGCPHAGYTKDRQYIE